MVPVGCRVFSRLEVLDTRLLIVRQGNLNQIGCECVLKPPTDPVDELLVAKVGMAGFVQRDRALVLLLCIRPP